MSDFKKKRFFVVVMKLFILVSLSCFVFSVHAQENDPDSLKNDIELDHVLIISPLNLKYRRNHIHINFVLNSNEIRDMNAQSTADVLSNSGQVFVQKSQMGGGSPVIRGFEASRIVLMMDGVRLNNLIYRTGHLQNIITSDNTMLERLEVLFGPGSALYGSDALGGVVTLYTKNPSFASSDQLETKVNFFTRFSSVNTEVTQHFDIELRKKRIASLTSFTYSKFGDLMSGKSRNPFFKTRYGERNFFAVRNSQNTADSSVSNPNPFLQVQSNYAQYDLMQKFSIKQNQRVHHLFNFQLSNSTNVFRYDRLSERDPLSSNPRFAEWYYGPQFRLLNAYTLLVASPTKKFDLFELKLNHQHIKESRFTRRFNSDFKERRYESVNVFSATLQMIKKVKTHGFFFGADMQHNTLKSEATRQNIVLDTVSNWSTRYPNGQNRMSTVALFFSHEWSATKKFRFQEAIRFGFSSLSSTISDFTFYPFPFSSIKQNTPVYSATVGMLYKINTYWKFSSNLGSGYRVPNVDDLSKIFDSNPTNSQVIVPNPSLKPEQTITWDLSILQTINKKTFWENTVYYTRFFNAINIGPAAFNGSDSIFYDGVVSKVYTPLNNKNALLYGFSTTFKSELNYGFLCSLNASYSYGRIITDTMQIPLDHIPPFILNAKLSYKFKQFSTSFFVNFNSWKRISDYNPDGEDNLQYATAKGMPAWFTLNLHALYKIDSHFEIQAGVDNILDTQYRTFASGINAPGRNLFARLFFSF
jgi:hemoglobin/transferrin/lactoferrin receptor protein